MVHVMLVRAAPCVDVVPALWGPPADPVRHARFRQRFPWLDAFLGLPLVMPLTASIVAIGLLALTVAVLTPIVAVIDLQAFANAR